MQSNSPRVSPDKLSSDVVVPESGWGKLGEQLIAELTAQPSNSVVAYRGNHRWVKTFEALDAVEGKTRLRQRGVYLITGGMWRYGFSPGSISRPDSKAKLVLVGRSDRLQRAVGAMAGNSRS